MSSLESLWEDFSLRWFFLLLLIGLMLFSLNVIHFMLSDILTLPWAIARLSLRTLTHFIPSVRNPILSFNFSNFSLLSMVICCCYCRCSSSATSAAVRKSVFYSQVLFTLHTLLVLFFFFFFFLCCCCCVVATASATDLSDLC